MAPAFSSNGFLCSGRNSTKSPGAQSIHSTRLLLAALEHQVRMFGDAGQPVVEAVHTAFGHVLGFHLRIEAGDLLEGGIDRRLPGERDRQGAGERPEAGGG